MTLIQIIANALSGGQTGYADGGFDNSQQGRENQVRDSISNQREWERQRDSKAQAKGGTSDGSNGALQPADKGDALAHQRKHAMAAQVQQMEGILASSCVHESSVPGASADINRARQKALDIASVIVDSAATNVNDSVMAPMTIETHEYALDLLLDFTPGASFIKDLLCLTTGVNPVTGAPVGQVEQGIIIACLIVPGALKGQILGVTQAFQVAQRAGRMQRGGAMAARELLPSLRAADAFISALKGPGGGEYAIEATTKLVSAASYRGDQVVKTAEQLRLTPGVARITTRLHDSEYFLRGTHSNAGWVPLEIAQSLEGQSFATFNELRESFWRTVSTSKYAKQFGSATLARMEVGNAPIADASQHLLKRMSYELHHVTPINRGGDVYDLSNLMVTTPRFHKEVLKRDYHYGK